MDGVTVIAGIRNQSSEEPGPARNGFPAGDAGPVEYNNNAGCGC